MTTFCINGSHTGKAVNKLESIAPCMCRYTPFGLGEPHRNGVSGQVAAAELKAKVAEAAARLRTQQAAYEAVRAERNTASRSLMEARDQAAEMLRKTDILVRTVPQTLKFKPFLSKVVPNI